MYVGRAIICAGLLLSLLLPGACSSQEPDPLPRQLRLAVDAGAETFDFAAHTTVPWDRMYVFGPYTSRDRVEQVLGFAWRGYQQTSIEGFDGVCLVVFVRDGSVVHWYEQPRHIELGLLANDTGYTPAEARFRIEREGRITLEPP